FVSHSPISFPFFSNVLSTTQLSSLSLHDALPISADTAGDGLCDCRLLLIGQVLIVRHLTIRHDEQMSVIVWKQIHHHVNELTSPDDEILLVAVFAADALEKPLAILRAEPAFQYAGEVPGSPGTPHPFHQNNTVPAGLTTAFECASPPDYAPSRNIWTRAEPIYIRTPAIRMAC